MKGDSLCHKVTEQDRQVRDHEPVEGLDPAVVIRVRAKAGDESQAADKDKVAVRDRDKVAVLDAEETGKKLYSNLQKGVKLCQVEMEQALQEWAR